MKSIIILLLSIVSLTANARENSFKLTVTLPDGVTNGKCYVRWTNGLDADQIDSVDVVDSKAVWSHDFVSPVMAIVSVASPQLEKTRATPLIILPNEKCNVTFFAKSGEIGGSKPYKHVGEAVKFMEGLTRENQKQKLTEYLQQHGSEEWAAILAMKCDVDFFLKNAQPTPRIKKLLEDIKSMQDREEEAREQEAQKAIDNMLNKPAPEFTLEDLNGI